MHQKFFPLLIHKFMHETIRNVFKRGWIFQSDPFSHKMNCGVSQKVEIKILILLNLKFHIFTKIDLIVLKFFGFSEN